MAAANQMPEGYKFAPLVTHQQRRVLQPEKRLLWTTLSLILPLPLASLNFLCSDSFLMKCSAPCSAVLCHSPSLSWAAVVHWSALMVKALRSSRKYPIHSISWLPTQPVPLTPPPNITHFGSLVSSIRGTILANKIRLLCIATSILSLPVLISVSR